MRGTIIAKLSADADDVDRHIEVEEILGIVEWRMGRPGETQLH